MLDALFESSRTTKRAISLMYDTLAMCAAFYIAIGLRLGTFQIPVSTKELTALGITIIGSLLLFINMGMYRAILRYMTQPAMLTIVGCVCASGIILAVASFLTYSYIPRSIIIFATTIKPKKTNHDS